jgi:methionyl-tRNA formyltransferase
VPERLLHVALVAEESAGVQVLHQLADLRPAVEIAAVLTTEDGGRQRRPVVVEAARKLGLETWPAELVRSSELAERLRQAQVDVLLNVHSLFLVHPDVVGAPAIGSFNLHPGPLPEYAGLNVPSWAVFNGEEHHGVTLHWMDDGIDTGPVAWMSRFDLSATETGLSVSGKCVRHGVPLVLKLVQVAQRDAFSIPRDEQNPARRRYFRAGPPQEGRLDWQQPAAEILRFVRAADYGPFPSPWGHPQAVLGEQRVGIAKAAATGIPSADAPGTVREVTEAGALVATGDELILVERLSLDGSRLKPQHVLAD